MTVPPSPLIIPGETAGSARTAPLGAPFKFFYSTGAMIDGITTGALTYFLLFYLTSVCGMSGTAAGAALLLGLVIDAFIDPAIGLLTDHTRSKTGRRHPYLLYSPIPTALLFGLLFSIPTWAHGAVLIAYATVCAMALRIGLSLFVLPYVSVGAEVTDDYAARSSLVSWRICFTMLGTFLAIGLGLGVFMSGPDGLLNRQAYIPFAWTCGAIMAIAGLTAARATRSVLGRLHQPPAKDPSIKPRLLAEIGEMFRNRSFVVLFAAVVAFFVAQGVSGALAIYLNSYFWSLSSAGIQMVLIGATLGPFIGAPVTALLSRWIDKKPLTIAAFVLYVVAMAWPVLARLSGVLEPGAGALQTILFVNALLGGAALVGGAIGAQSMMADSADEHEFLFGVRREGLFFSGLTLALKAATGLGGFIAGLALDLIHFPTDLAAKGGKILLTPEVSTHLGLIAGLLPAAITLLAPLSLVAYGLTRKRHKAILGVLAGRREPVT